MLRREAINIEAQKSTAAAVKALKADVVCMVEVESRLVLDDFNGQLLTGKARFSENMLIDGNDTRGSDLVLLSRLPIRSIRSHIFDIAKSKRPLFSRDCPEYELALPDGQSLWVLPNHLKSKGYGTQAANDARRMEQAQGIGRLLGRFNLQQDLVVVAGDLNDVPGSAPLAPLLQVPHLEDAFNLGAVVAADRWTYIYKGKQQIDYLLVSKALADRFISVGVERRGRPDNGKLTGGALKPFPTVTDWASSASDHFAV